MKLITTIAALALSAATTHAGIFTFTASLTGGSEVPPNGSPATGSATAIYDSSLNEFSIAGTFGGLSAPAFSASVRAGAVGVNGPSVLPLTITPATTGTLFGSTTGLTVPQTSGLLGGNWYVNVTDPSFPGGEIRGQLLLTSVPEPETYAAIAGLGLLGFAGWRRLRS